MERLGAVSEEVISIGEVKGAVHVTSSSWCKERWECEIIELVDGACLEQFKGSEEDVKHRVPAERAADVSLGCTPVGNKALYSVRVSGVTRVKCSK